MFVTFFHELKAAGVPVTLREYLTLMEAMEHDLAGRRVEDFYYLARTALVKDERNLDKFDRVFGHVFKGLELVEQALAAEIPAEWLAKLAEKYLSAEEKRQIEAMGGLDKLLETLAPASGGAAPPPSGRQQMDRHCRHLSVRGLRLQSRKACASGRTRAATSARSRSGTGASSRIWTTRSSSAPATSRSRCGGCAGSRAPAPPEELDLDGTIKGTAHKGYLDILMRPERHNAVKVLLFFDVGGSMDWHVKATEELFSAARAEFKHMEHFYFHNCLYERVWKENRRRFDHTTRPGRCCTPIRTTTRRSSSATPPCRPTRSWRRAARSSTTTRRPGRYGWSACCAPILPACGSIRCASTNGSYTQSVRIMRQLMGGRMYPLTLEGLDQAMRELVR